MKKAITIIMVLAALIVLVGCNGSEGDTLDVNVMNERLGFQTIDVHVVIPEPITDMDALVEITNDIARQSYQKNFSTIGTESYTLTVYLYEDEDDYADEDVTYGYHTFLINKSVTEPGISPGEDHLKID
jgi:predicted small secreted protein